MPATKNIDEVTTSIAMESLGVASRQAVLYMIRTGKLPGARQLVPGKRSDWLIPVSSIEAYNEKKAKEKKKRAAAVKA